MPFDQLLFPDQFTPIPLIDFMCTELLQTLPFKPGLLGTAPLQNEQSQGFRRGPVLCSPNFPENGPKLASAHLR